MKLFRNECETEGGRRVFFEMLRKILIPAAIVKITKNDFCAPKPILRSWSPTIGFTLNVTKIGLALSVLMFGLFISRPGEAQSKADLSFSGQLRSYPFGGSVDLEAGYSWLLWGQAASPWMGFVRPYLSSSHAGVYNSGQLGLEFFPLGFLGVRGGYEIFNNESDYQSYNCDTYECRGNWNRSFAEAEMALKYSKAFLVLRFGQARYQVEEERSLRPLIEPGLALSLPATETEEVRYARALLGWQWTPAFSTLIAMQTHTAIEQDIDSQFHYFVVNASRGEWSLLLGVGATRSDLYPLHASFIGGLRWELWPSFKLF